MFVRNNHFQQLHFPKLFLDGVYVERRALMCWAQRLNRVLGIDMEICTKRGTGDVFFRPANDRAGVLLHRRVSAGCTLRASSLSDLGVR
jgi:hypothetical protein